LHPLESAAFARRTPLPGTGHRQLQRLSSGRASFVGDHEIVAKEWAQNNRHPKGQYRTLHV
jgi:hypothetical protein